MKKVIAVFLSIIFVFSLTSCAKSGENAASDKSESNVELGKTVTLNESEDFKLNGLIVKGGLHNYGEDWKIENEEFKMQGLFKDFYLDEFIEIYIDGVYPKGSENLATIYCVPHIEDYSQVEVSEIAAAKAFTSGELIDVSASKLSLAVEGQINSKDFTAGLYDIVFVVGNKICYYLTVNVTAQK